MAVYAMSDLHGSLDLLRQIQSFLQKNDIVYVLGDCGDRGDEPCRTIKEVAKDRRFIYLKGNHEDMLVKAIREFQETGTFYEEYCRMLFHNGGYETMQCMLEERYLDLWCSYLENRPHIEVYTNSDGIKIYLSHAGFTPNTKDCSDYMDLIWNRTHYKDIYNENWENCIVVHGHTPIYHMCKYLGLKEPVGALWYANNRKVCLDCMTYMTNKIVLLNLDTFKQHIFETIGDCRAYRMV